MSVEASALSVSVDQSQTMPAFSPRKSGDSARAEAEARHVAAEALGAEPTGPTLIVPTLLDFSTTCWNVSTP